MFSKYACKNEEAIRLKEETEDKYRTPFFHDIDRIIYSLSYTRYQDKTQVFSFNENDHITKRMVHVQLVSKIGRTIGRNLGLNEDLIEAASLGHDLGHVPFGHVGERILNKISLENNEGYFNHNIESVRVLMYLEQNGRGQNITLQVLDAIMCHNGEIPLEEYRPIAKTKEEFLKEYALSYKEKDKVKQLRPMTLEGCVVRLSDIIAYIGKDIEDALLLGVIKKEDIPSSIIEVLGVENRNIVNTFVTDIIQNSKEVPFIKMSPKIYKALIELKEFNSKNIYAKANTQEEIACYEKMFRTLFQKYKKDIEEEKETSEIYQVFLKQMPADYQKETTTARKVIDFLAGMTDDYMKKCYLATEKNQKESM